MKIDFLKINSPFKNLDKVEIDFDKSSLMTVIIGWNGTGKSNLIEALVSIFRNLDLGISPLFDFEIIYTLGQNGDSKKPLRFIKVMAQRSWGKTPTKQYRVYTYDNIQEGVIDRNLKPIPLSQVKRNASGESNFLPKHLFAYYSGPSDRLEKYFRTHRTDFYKKLLDNKLTIKGEIRPLFYAKPIHSQFVLLAFFLGKKSGRERVFLEEQLGIYDLDSIHFVFRKPRWTKTANKNERFWGSSGTVRDFLDLVFPHAVGPIKIQRVEDVSLTGKNIKNEFYHLLLPNIKALRDVAKGLTDGELFKMLESTLLSELLSEVRIRIKKRGSSVPLSFSELSEGEQQLLTVLGLLKFTGDRDSLFLLDEPDTHLNPAWSVDYISFLKKFVPNQDTSHMIMVTHHPLAIAELEKEQVQIMWKNEKHEILVLPPDEDPKGMGYEGILTSDMFGLGSSLDKSTTSDLLKLHKLSTKEILSAEERKQLKNLREKLSLLDFNFASSDRLEREYVRARFDLAQDEEFENPIVTKENKKKALDVLIQSLLKSMQENG